MSEQQPLGHAHRHLPLGVTHSPAPGEMCSDAVVVMKVVDDEGQVSMRVAWSEGMSWIERVGLLRCAESVELPRPPDGETS